MSDVTKIPYSKCKSPLSSSIPQLLTLVLGIVGRLFYFVATPGAPSTKGALGWGLDDGVVKVRSPSQTLNEEC